jgi:type II secretory pathway predicted ATPase ExeA
MYEAYWGLKEPPFENTPDPRFFYRSHQHEEGLARLTYVVRQKKGAGMLSGVYGCGKTLIAHALQKELEKDVYRVAIIKNPRLSDVELVRRILFAFGHDAVPAGKTDAEVLLERTLTDNLRDGKRSVVIVDEAHTIASPEAFEELRLLLNQQTESEFLLSLLLFGQPELRDKIKQNKQFDQRIGMRYHLAALTPEETAGYIRHRLQVAGAKRELFGAEALALAHERSGGIPRRINQIADAALLVGFGKQKQVLDAEAVSEAVETVGGG